MRGAGKCNQGLIEIFQAGGEGVIKNFWRKNDRDFFSRAGCFVYWTYKKQDPIDS